MTSPPLAVAALLSAVLAWRHPSARQRTIAASLAALLGIGLARPHLAPWLPLYVGLFPAWYGVQTWAVVRTLGPSAPRTGQAFALLAASSVFAVRHDLTPELARASFALALAAQLLAVLRFAARGKAPDDAQGVALILAASSAADIAGPWLCGHAARDWYAGAWPAVITWIAVAAWEIRCLIRRQ